MKLRPLLFGVAIALLGVVLQIVYMRRFEQDVTGGAKVDLLVAAQPIERGKPIKPEMLGVRSVPRAYVDDRAVRASQRDKVLNLKAATKVPVLQTLVWTDLIAVTDDQRDLSSLVQPGNRAMTIRVMFQEVLQLVRPGDFVDLMSVDKRGAKSSILLQRVLVLATGLDTTGEGQDDRKRGRARVLTVSVSLAEAQRLALAQASSHLVAVVRNTGDPRITDSPPDVTRESLANGEKNKIATGGSTRPVKLQRGAN